MAVLSIGFLMMMVLFCFLFLVLWFEAWFKPLYMILAGIQFTLIGIFLLILWLALQLRSIDSPSNALLIGAIFCAVFGLLLTVSFAVKRS